MRQKECFRKSHHTLLLCSEMEKLIQRGLFLCAVACVVFDCLPGSLYLFFFARKRIGLFSVYGGVQ